MEVRGAQACAGCAAARHRVAPRVPRFAHAIHTRHAHCVLPIARSCDRLHHPHSTLHVCLQFLHNFPSMSHHSHTTPNRSPHTPASTIAHSRPPTTAARDPPIDPTRNPSQKQLQYNCSLSCSFPSTFHSPTTTSETALGLHATANTTRTSPAAQDRPAHAHTAAVPIPALHFATLLSCHTHNHCDCCEHACRERSCASRPEWFRTHYKQIESGSESTSKNRDGTTRHIAALPLAFRRHHHRHHHRHHRRHRHRHHYWHRAGTTVGTTVGTTECTIIGTTTGTPID
jgi:hypothetical protein